MKNQTSNLPVPEGVLAYRYLPDGRLLTVHQLFTGTARLTIGRGVLCYDDAW